MASTISSPNTLASIKQTNPEPWNLAALSNLSLTLSGILLLVDLPTVAIQTALTGTASWPDIFTLCPGIHKQHTAPDLHRGEYPAVAAMTTGYVFRIENPATVFYLQKISRTAHLTTLSVKPATPTTNIGWTSLHKICVVNTVLALALMVGAGDVFFVVTIALLMLSRVVNTVVFRRRAVHVWSGAAEPGVQGDLLVLMSQDRWVRVRGLVDDLKAVTSGSWLRPATLVEECLANVATVVVYLAVVVAANMTWMGHVVFLVLLTGNLALLGVDNCARRRLCMFGRMVVVEDSRSYARRLDMARELTEELKRDDWAVKLGMIGAGEARYSKVKDAEVIM